ncbi:MAG TPA: polymer-forming cytoskeletal protein, partial [Gemmatimonadales bacterium]
MPASKRVFGLIAVLAVIGQRPAHAEPGWGGLACGAAELVGHVRSLIHRRPRPQAIQAGGPAVDLSDLSRPTLIETRLRSALQPFNGQLRLTIPGGNARQGNFILESDETLEGPLLVVDGNADVYGHLQGNLVTVKGNVIMHPGGLVAGDVLTLGGELQDEGGEIGGEVRSLKSTNVLTPVGKAEAPALSPLQSVLRRVAGVLGVFLTLAVLGFGLVMFGRQNLETVSDTVSHSFGRAFITGLLGQILLLPTFGMLVVGLILSVAGILLLPFAIAVFAMLAVVAVVGGYLAVAHAMGETYT